MSVSPALSLILNTGLTALPEIAVRAKLYIGQGLLYGLHEYKLYIIYSQHWHTRVFPINFDDKPIFLLKKPLSRQVLVIVLLILALGYAMGLYLSFGSHVEGKIIFIKFYIIKE